MKRTQPRGLLVLVLIVAPILSAQQPSGKDETSNVFASPDGTFQFEYPTSLVRCTNDPNQHGWWKPAESCEAYTPVCPDSSETSNPVIACIAYPAERMKGTNFQAAAFAVREQKTLTTNAECLKIEEPPPHGQARKENLNGIMFTVVNTDGVAAGNVSEGYTYRAFHRSKCYELDITISSTDTGGHIPGTAKTFDREEVQRTLEAVLASFKFLD